MSDSELTRFFECTILDDRLRAVAVADILMATEGFDLTDGEKEMLQYRSTVVVPRISDELGMARYFSSVPYEPAIVALRDAPIEHAEAAGAIFATFDVKPIVTIVTTTTNITVTVPTPTPKPTPTTTVTTTRGQSGFSAATSGHVLNESIVAAVKAVKDCPGKDRFEKLVSLAALLEKA